MSLRHAVVPSLALCVAAALSGCGYSGSATQPSETPKSDDWPAALATTPLEFRDALNSLDVFGECLIGKVREDLTGSPTEVVCYVVKAEYRANYTDQTRGVGVYVFRAGSWPTKGNRTLCWDKEAPVVSDGSTFLAMGSPGGTHYGDWPPEVWPEDVQRVLGGRVTPVSAFC